jgi:hypothetical protein
MTLNVLKIVHSNEGGAVFSNCIKVFIDDVELIAVQSIDFPIDMNEFVYATIRFAPGKIEWVNMDPEERIYVHKKGHFQKGAWVWDD